MPSICKVLSEFISSTDFNKIPTQIIQKAKMCVLDTLGTALLGSKTKAARILNKTIKSLSLPCESTVIGANYKTSYLYAAYANSMEAAYLELDDGHREAGIHPGCIMIPTALAVGEYIDVSGKEILEAIILGYEVAIRIGLATGMAQFRRRIDAPATCGVFGAVATAGKLMKLDEDQLTNALAIAGAQSPLSPSIWYYEPSMVKSLPIALASFVGILSALLAKEGFTGPLNILEGKGGFCETTSSPEKCQLDKITAGLGEEWEIRGVYFKFYPSCRWTHSAIDATLGILKERKINPQEVEEIVVRTYSAAAQLTTPEPKDDTVARLSIPYNVAVALLYGEVNLDKFDYNILNNPKVLELARKVIVIDEPSFRSLYPSARPTTVSIKLRNGSECSNHVDYPFGEPENPHQY